ncbi:hypothetical protein QQ045_020505 [Rhodiola kirilowii]
MNLPWYIRCAMSYYGIQNVTELPIDARDPLYKSEREVSKVNERCSEGRIPVREEPKRMAANFETFNKDV